MAMIYSWAVRREILRYTPFLGLEKPFAEQPRTRSFGNDEIRRLFGALTKAPKQIAAVWLMQGAGPQRELDAARPVSRIQEVAERARGRASCPSSFLPTALLNLDRCDRRAREPPFQLGGHAGGRVTYAVRRFALEIRVCEKIVPSAGLFARMPMDSYRFLDFASRRIMKAWAARQEHGVVPFTRLGKPLRECTVALVSTAGVARRDDRPFDQEGERRNPWWGDPSFREIPLGATENDVRIYHLHVDPRFAEADLDVVLPMRRLSELAAEGVVGHPAPTHYSTMGYILEPTELLEQTAPAIADRMLAERIDAAALVPA